MNSNEIRELELIEKIKLQDSEALKQLCNIYQPLIRSISNNYFLRIYDYQDWQQEAMIVCYSCAQSFSRERGSFAGYFRRRLTRHLCNKFVQYLFGWFLLLLLSQLQKAR